MVRTKEELAAALKAKQADIHVVGPLAEEIKRKAKRRKTAKYVGGAMMIGGILAAPFTGGASLIGSVGVAALTAGLVISTSELLIIAGCALAITAVCKGYNVQFNKDGSIILTNKKEFCYE